MQFFRMMLIAWVAAGLSFSSPNATAAAFDKCPSKAFLIQKTIATLYGVNLATGYYAQLSANLGTSDKINAIGFNFHDNYLYGWGYEAKAPVRVDRNYKATRLTVENLPQTNFFVGDVAVDRNVYYFYKRGANYGLYALPLAPGDGKPLRAKRVVDGAKLNLAIFDFAFHPTLSYAYAVDSKGVLHEIDPVAGTSRTVSNVGQRGTFGAAYFDVNGYLYISRNSDGFVYRIDLTATTPVAEFYAYGPSSNNNDGARCALAPLLDASSQIDFGDAPDSYGTTFGSNGARHDLDGSTIYLGARVDGESDAYLFPLSDDTADRSDDEDGVQFVSTLEINEQAIIKVTASAQAYLNAWVDWNRDGGFSDDEHMIAAKQLSAGENSMTVNVPFWASAGSTWARFRYSSTASIGPIGGAGDGEVEDYAVSIVAAGVTESWYPAARSWSTVAYEDNWPLTGDYDMNDLVMHLRMRELRRNAAVIGVEIDGELVAVGGDYHSGFAIRLPGVDAAELADDAVQFFINDQRQSGTPLERNSGDAVFIIANDVWDYVSPGEACRFYRTEAGCEADVQMHFTLRVAFASGVSSFPAAPYDPFLFATPGFDRGYLFVSPPGRKLEIHLPGQAPTDTFDRAFLGLGDDASDAAKGIYFRNASGMSWALHIGNSWNYPNERVDLSFAYPPFKSYAESEGLEDSTWYLTKHATPGYIFGVKR